MISQPSPSHSSSSCWTTYHQTLSSNPTNVMLQTKNEKHNSLKRVLVPTSGYYTMSFGTKRHLEEFETIHVASAHENDVKYCGCTFQIHWSSSNTSSSEGTSTSSSSSIFKNNHHPTLVELLLPLSHSPFKSKQKKQSYVTSTRIASILYLTKGTEFHIMPLHSCHSSYLVQDPEYDSCCGPFQFTLQLYMDQNVETRFYKQAHMYYKTNTTTAIQANHEQHDAPIHQSILNNHKYIDLHPMEYKKKPWVCVECKRCFDSPKATRNHCISKHAIPSTLLERGTGSNCHHLGEDYSDLIGPEIFHIPLVAVYEDDDIAIVVKPQGIPVQGGRWTLNNTDLLLPFCAPKGTEGALSKPRTTHRLDSATGGLLVIAKTHESETKMNQMFEMKVCKKRYRAIVFGKINLNQHDFTELSTQDTDKEFEGLGIIHACIGNKLSLTRYRIISYTPCNHPLANGFVTTVDLWPVTGRTHQLRKHLQMIGHPIWGDLRYASYDKDERNSIRANKDLNAPIREYPHSRMCLWALEICFPHPVKSDQFVKAVLDEPDFYNELRETLISNYNGIN